MIVTIDTDSKKIIASGLTQEKDVEVFEELISALEPLAELSKYVVIMIDDGDDTDFCDEMFPAGNYTFS